MQYMYIYNYFLYSLPYIFLFFHIQNRHVGPTSCLSQSQADTWHPSSSLCGRPARGAHVPATAPSAAILSPRVRFPAAISPSSGHLFTCFHLHSLHLFLLYAWVRVTPSHTPLSPFPISFFFSGKLAPVSLKRRWWMVF